MAASSATSHTASRAANRRIAGFRRTSAQFQKDAGLGRMPTYSALLGEIRSSAKKDTIRLKESSKCFA
jgi:cell fate (sporulation/competence/biofilm development) regulator YlbF (YheA/YmcA/DUF963 family)